MISFKCDKMAFLSMVAVGSATAQNVSDAIDEQPGLFGEVGSEMVLGDSDCTPNWDVDGGLSIAGYVNNQLAEHGVIVTNVAECKALCVQYKAQNCGWFTYDNRNITWNQNGGIARCYLKRKDNGNVATPHFVRVETKLLCSGAIIIEDCDKYNFDGSCSSCSSGFVLAGAKCVQNKIEHCGKYDSDGSCSTCNSGFFLADAKCKAKIEYCSNYDNDGKCTRCSQEGIYKLDLSIRGRFFSLDKNACVIAYVKEDYNQNCDLHSPCCGPLEALGYDSASYNVKCVKWNRRCMIHDIYVVHDDYVPKGVTGWRKG